MSLPGTRGTQERNQSIASPQSPRHNNVQIFFIFVFASMNIEEFYFSAMWRISLARRGCPDP
jgi:hypothetical protein